MSLTLALLLALLMLIVKFSINKKIVSLSSSVQLKLLFLSDSVSAATLIISEYYLFFKPQLKRPKDTMARSTNSGESSGEKNLERNQAHLGDQYSSGLNEQTVVYTVRPKVGGLLRARASRISSVTSGA